MTTKLTDDLAEIERLVDAFGRCEFNAGDLNGRDREYPTLARKASEKCAAARERLLAAIRSLAAPASRSSSGSGEREALEAAEKALVRAREALNHDRTGLAAALCRIREEVRGRFWMRHEKDGGEAGSWGSYPYPEHTVETLRREISWAFGAIGTFAEKALNASGNLAGVEIRAMEEPLGHVRRALSSGSPSPATGDET